MDGISGVSYSSYSSTYSQIASGSKLQSASDGASELAIVEEENVQVTGYEVGSDNMASAVDALNISDTALGAIGDYLQRIRELAVEAGNDLLSDSDKESIQAEIDELKQGITDTASQTSYNTINLLDGSTESLSVATDANGGTATVTTANATLEALGIADFDVTTDFSLDDIDNAIAAVSEARSEGGAQTNALEYSIDYNSQAAYYTTAAKSNLEDVDIPQAVTEQKKQQALMAYQYIMQKHKQEADRLTVQSLYGA